MDIVNRIENIIINESKLLGRKKFESITTTSAGVPGEGPIAASQNGLSGQTQEYLDAMKKNKKMIKSLMMRRKQKKDEFISESDKLSTDEIISILGGKDKIKKMGTNFENIWKKIQSEIIEIIKSFNIKKDDIDLNSLKTKIKNITQ